MSEVLITVGVGVAAFVSTNLDNLFLLMAMMKGSSLGARAVVLGYGSAMALVLAVGTLGSYAGDLVADAWLRYLGLIPLAMGVWRLWDLRRGVDPNAKESAPSQAGGAASVFGVMLANSGDSLGVFTSLMSETSELLVLVIFATALAMSGLWVAAARWLVEHPALAPHLRRLDRYLVPILLLAIGIYILSDTATDTV